MEKTKPVFADQELSFETVSGYLATMTDVVCGWPLRRNPFRADTLEKRNWDYGRAIALRPLPFVRGGL